MQGTEERLAYWPNGNVQSRMEARRNLQGEVIRDGRAVLFREDGALSARGQFVDDLEQGRWTWYDPEGRPRAYCDYVDGVGEYKDVFPDGRTLREGQVVGLRRVGHWREYYPSGRLKLEGGYVDDQQHGEWTAYTDEDPPRVNRARFDHGQLVERD